jgi:tRNA A37 N6-isopentenylltransferase MiaA
MVIIICGPTGIDKTTVGIELAGTFGGAIISGDSMQIYQHNDTYRIIRAVVTIESTDKSISKYHQNHGFEDEPFNEFKMGLRRDREKLCERIDQRVVLMIQAGLVEEVKKLLAMG